MNIPSLFKYQNDGNECRLVLLLFEFITSIVGNLTYISIVEKDLIKEVTQKCMSVQTLAINFTYISTVEKYLIKAVISKFMFVYTLVINVTNVSTIEKKLFKYIQQNSYCILLSYQICCVISPLMYYCKNESVGVTITIVIFCCI